MEEAATHIFALALAIRTYGCRIIEFGGGFYSTPLIHGISNTSLTIEENKTWFDHIRTINDCRIRLSIDIVKDAIYLCETEKPDVVLVDCYEANDRLKIASCFIEKPCCVVCHDTERSYWDELISSVKYVKHFHNLIPRTSWISNVVKFSQ